MKAGAFLALLFLFSTSIVAQTRELDSLLLALENAEGNIGLKASILNQIAYAQASQSPEKGIEYALSAYKLAKENKDEKNSAEALKNLGINQITLGKDSLALLNYKKALSLFTKINDTIGRSNILYAIGLYYFGKSDYKTSNQYYQNAFSLTQNTNNHQLKAKILKSQGVNFMYAQNDYPAALEKMIEALKLHDAAKDTLSVNYAQILGNMGLVYNRMMKFDEAINYQQKALAIHQLHQNKMDMARTLANMATSFSNLNESSKAMELYKQALLVNTEIGYKAGMASDLTNIGMIHYYDGEFDKAMQFLKQTENLYTELGNKTNLSLVYNAMGGCLQEANNAQRINMGISEGERLNLAIEYHKKSIKLAKEIGALDREGMAWDYLTQAYVKKNDFKNAYMSLTEAATIMDSMYRADKAGDAAKMQAKYEYEKKEAVLKAVHDKNQALAQAEINRQKTIKTASILGGSGLLLATLGGLVLYKRKRDAVQQRREAQFASQVADTELKALRAQMNPHFIFNSLNSISDYISKNNIEQANNYLVKFAGLMRQTLENSEKKQVLLSEDLKLLRLYMEAEALRMQHSFSFTIKIDPEIDPENTLVPPLILQPFVENSIKHGMKGMKNEGHIQISIKKENEMVVYQVEDNGVGFQENANNKEKVEEKKSSLGFKITKDRINIINKQKYTNGSVEILNKENGVKVEVKLPLELAY